MGHRDDFKNTADSRRSSGPASGRKEGSAKDSSVAKAFRAVTAIVVFGVPLVAGTTALLSYGVHKAYKRITGGSSSILFGFVFLFASIITIGNPHEAVFSE